MTRPFFSPKNVRSEFYAYFYPLVFSGGQISMALTAQLAYSYQWQYMYYFVMILQLLAILFVLLFFRYARRPIRFPFREIDWKACWSALPHAAGRLRCHLRKAARLVLLG